MIARYSGRCNCGRPFKKGAEISYNRAKKMVTACPKCGPEDSHPLEGELFDRMYEDQCSAACGLDSMSY